MGLYVAYALAYALMTMKRGDVPHHVQAARRDYGVAVDTATWTVDEAATARLRTRMGPAAVEVPAD